MASEHLHHFELKNLANLSELSDQEYQKRLDIIRKKTGFICDMDGVIYHGNKLIPGVIEFIDWIQRNNKKFVFLTNNSAPTPKELSQKLARLGLNIEPEHFYTAAIATAKFLASQKPNGGTCYVIGEPGLTLALYEHGFVMNDSNPDYVVIGESTSYNFEKITKASNLVWKGAKLIATNPDCTGLSEHGIYPSCGAFISAIELTTGKKGFYCGKPSPLMMRYAQSILGTSKEDTCIIGDRMDTDVLAGTTSQIDPVLVMSGVTTGKDDIFQHAYRPYIVLNSVGDISDQDTHR